MLSNQRNCLCRYESRLTELIPSTELLIDHKSVETLDGFDGEYTEHGSVQSGAFEANESK